MKKTLVQIGRRLYTLNYYKTFDVNSLPSILKKYDVRLIQKDDGCNECLNGIVSPIHIFGIFNKQGKN